VSHDRAFLDAICTNILHVEARTSESYRGNYSAFVPQRAERRLARERAMEKQRAFVKKEEEYIRRNLAGVNSFQAKGKRKRLERLPRLAPPPGDPAAMNLRFEPAERGGDQVVAIKELRAGVVPAGPRRSPAPQVDVGRDPGPAATLEPRSGAEPSGRIRLQWR